MDEEWRQGRVWPDENWVSGFDACLFALTNPSFVSVNQDLYGLLGDNCFQNWAVLLKTVLNSLEQ